MGEIKSTLDLAMEKTRNMTFTREEQERRSAEETRVLARALASRYLEEKIELRELEKKVAPSEELRKGAAAELIRALSLDAVPERLFSGLARLLGDRAVEAHKRTSDLFQRYADELKTLAAGLAGAARDELAHAGISGPAVRLNPEASKAWREQRIEIREKYDVTLRGIVEEVISLI